jgi:hypothetical protein
MLLDRTVASSGPVEPLYSGLEYGVPKGTGNSSYLVPDWRGSTITGSGSFGKVASGFTDKVADDQFSH